MKISINIESFIFNFLFFLFLKIWVDNWILFKSKTMSLLIANKAFKLKNYNSACSSQTGHKVFDLTEVRNFSFPIPIMQYASFPPFPFSRRFRAFVTKIKSFLKKKIRNCSNFFLRTYLWQLHGLASTFFNIISVIKLVVFICYYF